MLSIKPHSKKRRLRNASPNCKPILFGSNSFNYNTHIKRILVYKNRKIKSENKHKNHQCGVLQITQYEVKFVILIHESSQCSYHVQIEPVQ
jgi:hypothetical protein